MKKDELIFYLNNRDLLNLHKVLLRYTSPSKDFFNTIADVSENHIYIDVIDNFLEIISEENLLLSSEDKRSIIKLFYRQAKAHLFRQEKELFHKTISLLGKILNFKYISFPSFLQDIPQNDIDIFKFLIHPYVPSDFEILLQDTIFNCGSFEEYKVGVNFVYIFKDVPHVGKMNIKLLRCSLPSFILSISDKNNINSSISFRALEASVRFLKEIGFREDVINKTRVEWFLSGNLPSEYIRGNSLSLSLSAGIVCAFSGIPEVLLDKFAFTGDISEYGEILAVSDMDKKQLVSDKYKLICPGICKILSSSIYPVNNLREVLKVLLNNKFEKLNDIPEAILTELIRDGISEALYDMAYIMSLHKDKISGREAFQLSEGLEELISAGILTYTERGINFAREYMIDALAVKSSFYRSSDFLKHFIPDLFTGRTHLIEKLMSFIQNKETIILTGLCNIGKTSLISTVINKLIEDGKIQSINVFYYCFKEGTSREEYRNFLRNLAIHIYLTSPSWKTKQLLYEVNTKDLFTFINKVDCILFLDDLHFIEPSIFDEFCYLLKEVKNRRIILVSRNEIDVKLPARFIKLEGLVEEDLPESCPEDVRKIFIGDFKGYPPLLNPVKTMIEENENFELDRTIGSLYNSILNLLKDKKELLSLFNFLAFSRIPFKKKAFHFSSRNTWEFIEFLLKWNLIVKMQGELYRVNEIIKLAFRDYLDFLDQEEKLRIHSYWADKYYIDDKMPEFLEEKIYHLICSERVEEAWMVIFEKHESLYKHGINLCGIFNDLERKFYSPSLYGLMGIYLHRSGELMESINNLEKALSSDKLDFKERILYQNEKGYIKYRLGEFEEARLIIEKSLSLLEENNFTDSELSGDTLHLLSKVQNKLNHEVTINTLEKARNIFHSLKSFNKLLEINNTMAVYYENRGKPSASLPYCEDNIKKLEKSKEGNLPELAKCYGIMSRCLFLMGKFIESLDYKQKDLEIVKTIGDKRETAKLYNEIADSLILTGKLDEAGKYLELAEEEYETSCDKFGKAHLLNIKAKLYLKENKFKEALGLCGEAIDIYESMNLTLNIQEVNILRGRIYGIQGRVEEGEKLLEEALNILGKYKYESGLISYELALISKNKGKYYLGRAREIFEDMKNEYWIERLNEIKI